MLNKLEIAKDWLPRYTGMPLNKFGENILLTNFSDYVENFSDRFKADVYGEKKPMQACTNSNGLTIINFGIGSPNAATIMDLLTACKGYDYRTGVIHTTNRRVWEHDKPFLEHLKQTTCIGIDMETATIFIVGHYNEISRGALLLVSDVPVEPDGVKTEESDKEVTEKWSEQHLELGINSMTEISKRGEQIQHFRY